jgi:hypothetical protein
MEIKINDVCSAGELRIAEGSESRDKFKLNYSTKLM